MSEMQLQATSVLSPIPVVPAVTGPILPEAVDIRPDPAPQRFARYPK